MSRRALSSAAFAVLVMFASATTAETPTVPRLLGSLMIMLAVVEACDLDITADQRAGIAAAGERMQARAGMSDADAQALGAEMIEHVRETDCAAAAASFPDVYERTMAEVAGIP